VGGSNRALRRLLQIGPALLLVAVFGFAVGACGGGTGGALSTRTGTVTRELPTRETTTETVTTPGATTTREHIIATTATTTVTFTEATTAESASSGSSWGWVALGIGLGLAALAIILWALHRRRAGAEAWGKQTADLNRRALVALDDVVARGSVVTGQIEALASEARSLESAAPDDPSRAAAANVVARLDELAATLQSDRALRLSSPAPSEEQLAYSTAVIRQQVEQLQGALRLPAAPA
jgi:hypothetical protein